MVDAYDPEQYTNFPHTRYKCECGRCVTVVGHEVEAVFCPDCDRVMEWDADLHIPDRP